MSWNSNNVHTQSGWSQYQDRIHTKQNCTELSSNMNIFWHLYWICIDNIPQFSNIQVEECLVRVRRSEGDNLALQELADVEQEGETQQRADVAHLGRVDTVFVSYYIDIVFSHQATPV